MSPRRFNRRTYMIAASGRSALTFKAAMSASSAPTTIRSALPFAITPTVMAAFSQELTRERRT